MPWDRRGSTSSRLPWTSRSTAFLHPRPLARQRVAPLPGAGAALGNDVLCDTRSRGRCAGLRGGAVAPRRADTQSRSGCCAVSRTRRGVAPRRRCRRGGPSLRAGTGRAGGIEPPVRGGTDPCPSRSRVRQGRGARSGNRAPDERISNRTSARGAAVGRSCGARARRIRRGGRQTAREACGSSAGRPRTDPQGVGDRLPRRDRRDEQGDRAPAVLSTRTVDMHVRNVLRKLDSRSARKRPARQLSWACFRNRTRTPSKTRQFSGCQRAPHS